MLTPKIATLHDGSSTVLSLSSAYEVSCRVRAERWPRTLRPSPQVWFVPRSKDSAMFRLAKHFIYENPTKCTSKLFLLVVNSKSFGSAMCVKGWQKSIGVFEKSEGKSEENQRI